MDFFLDILCQREIWAKKLKIRIFDLKKGVNVISRGVLGEMCTKNAEFFLRTLSKFHEILSKIAKYTRILTEKEWLT